MLLIHKLSTKLNMFRIRYGQFYKLIKLWIFHEGVQLWIISCFKANQSLGCQTSSVSWLQNTNKLIEGDVCA